MFKVFNTEALSRNQRFQKAVIAGIVATIVLGLGYGILADMLHFEFSVVFLLIGYGIGWAIRTYGRGVQVKFSILGAICAVVCFLLADMIALGGFNIFLNLEYFGMVFQFVLSRLLSVNINSLLALLFRVGGVYAAYISSRIV